VSSSKLLSTSPVTGLMVRIAMVISSLRVCLSMRAS
jgi:hypothetical protein